MPRKKGESGYRLFKSTYRDGAGATRETSKWYAEFRDHNLVTRRLPAFTDKAASGELGRNVVKLVAFYKASGGQIDPSLSRWLAELPPRTRERLIAIGVVPAERAAVSKPLSAHLDDWAKALTAKGCGHAHVDKVTNRVRRIVEGCGFRFYADIAASKVVTFLHGLRQDTVEPEHKAEDGAIVPARVVKRGISAQTFNFYIVAVKGFCRWLVKDRRAHDNPLAHLEGLNVRLDRRHDRRALSADELRRLLQAAEHGPDRYGMSGHERAMLYELAVETGLRANELRSLTRASFDFDVPAVTLQAAYSKRRRVDTRAF
jgi:hypothetical protein